LIRTREARTIASHCETSTFTQAAIYAFDLNALRFGDATVIECGVDQPEHELLMKVAQFIACQAMACRHVGQGTHFFG